jgi:hypothetical protein
VGGGFVPDTFAFTNPRGHVFLAIDGACHFYVSDNYLRGIYSGSLSAADADALAKDLHWLDLASWKWGVQQDAACPDAGGVFLIREHVSAACSCGCDAAAPSGLADALMKSQTWMTRLLGEGKPVDGSVSALAFEGTQSSGSVMPVLDWPLTRAVSTIANLVRTHNDPVLMSDGPFAQFDQADAAKLRELRTATLKGAISTPGSIAVRDAGTSYELYLRDELPEAAAKAWDALYATVSSKP